MNTQTRVIRTVALAAAAGGAVMAARPTVFNGEVTEPVARFSSAWETKLRPNFPASKPIAALKDLHLRTPLVTDGKPACVLLVPEGRYADAVTQVRAAIQERTRPAFPAQSFRERLERDSRGRQRRLRGRGVRTHSG